MSHERRVSTEGGRRRVFGRGRVWSGDQARCGRTSQMRTQKWGAISIEHKKAKGTVRTRQLQNLHPLPSLVLTRKDTAALDETVNVRGVDFVPTS